MRKTISIWTILFFAISFTSCENKKERIKSAKKTVSTFVANIPLDNYETMFKLYPDFKEVKKYWKISEFNITSENIDKENKITLIGKSDTRDVLFEVKKIDGEYTIIKSVGLSSDYNSEIYKFCKKIGCMGLNQSDKEVSRICSDKRLEFDRLVEKVRNRIEESVMLKNHTLTQNYNYLSGDVTIINNSRFTIPGSSYNLYLNYYDSEENIAFTSKENFNYESIPFNQSRTLHVFEDNSGSFQKVGVQLKVISIDFIKKIVSEFGVGSNCVYDNNL